MWDKLIAAAMIGTDRAALAVSDDDTPALAARALAAGTGDLPARVLAAAAAAGVHRRAGVMLPVGMPDAPIDPDTSVETLPACSARTILNLYWLFTQQVKHKPLILEALILIARKGKRIPHPYLPTLLDLAAVNRKDERWLAVVARVMGERGKWLATAHKAWNFLDEPMLWDRPIPDDPPTMTREQEAWALKYLEDPDLAYIDPATLNELIDHGAIWTRKVAAAFVSVLTRTCAKLRSPGALSYLNEAAPFIARTDIDFTLNRLKENGIGAENGIASFIEWLTLRQAMLKDIAHE
jgi:hypothetical protein